MIGMGGKGLVTEVQSKNFLCPGFWVLHPVKGGVPNCIPGVMNLGLAHAGGTTIPKYL